MALSLEEVDGLAFLARLSLTNEEKQIYANQLAEILDYFEKLQELDTETIEPMASVLPLHTILREDVAGAGLNRDILLQNLASEDRESAMFRVNTVIDRE
jgi:aspartyl-tRNA(Asn)/glutamyl-tRNA(Gln) amidotransferase subunit C